MRKPADALLFQRLCPFLSPSSAGCPPVQYIDAIAKAWQQADTAKQYQDAGRKMEQKLAQARHELEQVGSQLHQPTDVNVSILP